MFSWRKRRESSLFYGWYVVAAAFGILFLDAGARHSFGVMFKPMIAEFGWDRGALSFAFFLNMAVYALSLVVAGRLYDRYGPKRVVVVSAIVLSIGYLLISRISSLSQFLVCYGVVAAIGLSGPSVSLMAAVTSKWFARWRGAAVSLALSGNSLGQFVLIPFFTRFVSHYGWRASYFLIGMLVLVVDITLVLLVIRGDPEDLGYKPYGQDDQQKPPGDTVSPRLGANPRDLGLSEAMRTPSFWLFLIVMFICGSGDFLVTTHLIPFVTDHGVSAITAGRMLAWFGLMSLLGILVAGPASDVIGNRIPIALTFVIRFFLFLLILKYKTPISFYVFALAFGFTFLITAPLTPTLMGKLYGFSHIGLFTGFITTVHHFGGGFWAYMGGVIFDRRGSYELAFMLSALMALVAVLATLLIREKRHHTPFDRRSHGSPVGTEQRGQQGGM